MVFLESKKPVKRKVRAVKSRVKVYKTIQQALERGHFGQIFSTERAGRLYVTSKGRGKHQAKDVPTSGGRIAKGFTPGSATPSADWPSVKQHAVRVTKKHGKHTSKRLEKLYGPGSKKKGKK